MTSSDGDRMAPVTYLFGSPQQEAVTQGVVPSPSEGPESFDASSSSAADSSSGVAFRDESKAESPKPEKRGQFEPINNVSMYALARRGMSALEMADYLTGRDFDENEVELECQRLLGVGLLDDFLLAETLVRAMRERKGLGKSSITAELRRRKIDASAIEHALDDLGDDELERAVAIAEKRAPQLRSLDSATAKRRLGAFLMRKGYSGSVVSTAVARALEPSGPVFR